MLNISVKTVEAYLTRLYRKTSCSSRVELAVAITERRLGLGSSDEEPDGGGKSATEEEGR